VLGQINPEAQAVKRGIKVAKLGNLLNAPFWVGSCVRNIVLQYFFESGSGTEDGLEESESATS